MNLTIDTERLMNDDRQSHQTPDDNSSKDDMQARIEALQAWFKRGAEPYWMQDIRLAQRKIERQRASGPDTEG